MGIRDDGGAAFPLPLGDEQISESSAGMSIRDYFAAKSMQGILAGTLADGSTLDPNASENIANASYRIAEAMLKERAK